MNYKAILVCVMVVCGASCERHSFDGPEGTKQLNPPPHSSGAAHGDGHADAHGEKPAAH